MPDFDKVLPSSPRTVILNKYSGKKEEQTSGYTYMPQDKIKGLTIGHKDEHGVLPGLFA